MRHRIKEKNWLLIVIMGILSGYLLAHIWMYGTILSDNDMSGYGSYGNVLS